MTIYDLNRPICVYGYKPVMGSKIGDLKEVKRSIKPLKIQLDYVNYRKSDTDDVKYPDSSGEEGNHEKRQSSNEVNPALTRKWGLIKDKIINHNSA